MDWSLATWWWIVAGALVAAELATGTFYLLMLALGAAAAALGAHAGLSGSLQIVTAALVAALPWPPGVPSDSGNPQRCPRPRTGTSTSTSVSGSR